MQTDDQKRAERAYNPTLNVGEPREIIYLPEPPLVKGGQDKSAWSVAVGAWTVGVTLLVAAVIALAALIFTLVMGG